MTDFTCDFCLEPFYGPVLTLEEEFWMKVELAAGYCSVLCLERSLEAAGIAEAARALR